MNGRNSTSSGTSYHSKAPTFSHCTGLQLTVSALLVQTSGRPSMTKMFDSDCGPIINVPQVSIATGTNRTNHRYVES